MWLPACKTSYMIDRCRVVTQLLPVRSELLLNVTRFKPFICMGDMCLVRVVLCLFDINRLRILPGATIVPVLNVSSRVFWLELDDKALLDSLAQSEVNAFMENCAKRWQTRQGTCQLKRRRLKPDVRDSPEYPSKCRYRYG